MKLELLDPQYTVPQPFPHIEHGGRVCYAVPAGAEFNVRSAMAGTGLSATRGRGRIEYVVAVDGRDTLTNQPASSRAQGLITGATYECRGFRTGDDGVRRFVCERLGEGVTTTERAGTTSSAGLVSVAAYSEKIREVYRNGTPVHSRGGIMDAVLRSTSSHGLDVGDIADSLQVFGFCVGTTTESTASLAPVMRSAGPSAGTAASAFLTDRVQHIVWERGDPVGEEVIEYDTPEGWAARGVSFAPVALLLRSPWPADAPRFCDPSKL